MRRGGFRPRHLVLSSRLGAPLQRDGLGRVVVREERVHSCGETAQRLDYDSFGRVLCDTNPGFQPFGFQSGLYDPDTGLVEFGCRWYDAETGRWISKDPILLDGGWNVYAFCGNDPINRMDPSGEDFMSFMFAASDFFAGFGDTISFGATKAFREAVYPEIGLSDITDTSSGAYTAGEYSGVAYDIALGAAGGWAAGGTMVCLADIGSQYYILQRCDEKGELVLLDYINDELVQSGGNPYSLITYAYSHGHWIEDKNALGRLSSGGGENERAGKHTHHARDAEDCR